jgi:Putative zinc-finger
MSSTCRQAISWDELCAYWADDLASSDLERVEEHLMSCAACSDESARVESIARAVRELLPPIISHEKLVELHAGALRVRENPIAPGERKVAVFSPDLDLLVHRLGGLELRKARRVRVTISVEETGDVLVEVPEAPFDPESGEILVACQRHFAALPPNIVVEVRADDAAGVRFAIPHQFQV